MKIENVHRCPYCGYMYQAILGQNVYSNLFSDPGGNIALHSVIYICPHIACKKIEVSVDAGMIPVSAQGKIEGDRNRMGYDISGVFFSERILPRDVGGKPEFKVAEVPEVIFRDYDEACRLLGVSPSASATYARRCLQSMVRKKFKLKPGKFQNEIKTLSSVSGTVKQEVIEALESVRRMGRFRAMPEDDVRVIAEITYAEARKIIDIIEVILCDWFVAPAEQDKRAGALRAILERKSA
ncbi:MAG: DUF4145 domain-containing protein [Synergistaceae bacterium]|jgi:hypothetical protein|nr:DUF4145 domain-containing protein [Synergistaceae bacterium]